MVNKIAVNPLEVRGAGNIVSPKSLTDYGSYNSKLVEASEDVNGTTMTVYSESYLSGSYMTVTAPKYVVIGTESATVSAVLKYISTDSLINSAPVACYVNDLLIESKSTDGNGAVSFTIPVTDTVGVYTVKLRYAGNTNVAGCFAVVRFYQYDITDLNLIGDKSVIQSGDTCNLIATLTGTGVNGEIIPIQGQKVILYEEYSPGLSISSNKNIIQSGETANISLQLKDADDGSLVRKSGVSIGLYMEAPYTYFNDGTDLTTLTIPRFASVTVEDGALKITTSVSTEQNIAYDCLLNNTDNFIFECEVAKLGTSQSIAMYVKNSTTANGCWFAYEDSTGKFGGGCLGSTFSGVDTGTLAVGDKIRIKQENGVITLYHNDAVIYSKTADLGTDFKIGHYTNNGRVQYIKNITIMKE